MQERCPNCGNYFTGPAHPMPERALVNIMIACCAVGAFAGCVIGAEVVNLFVINPGSFLRAAVVLLCALIVGLVIWFIFSIIRDRKDARRNRLAHLRRCSTCGLVWPSEQRHDERQGWSAGRIVRAGVAFIIISLFPIVVTAYILVATPRHPCTMHFNQAQMIVSPTSDMGASLGSVFARQWQSGAWYDQRTEATNPTTGYIFAGPFPNERTANAWSVVNHFDKGGATVCTGRYR